MKNFIFFFLLAFAGLPSSWGQCTIYANASGVSTSGHSPLYETTGSSVLDKVFVTETALSLDAFVLPKVDLYFYDDSSSPNAYAHNGPSVGQVVFGLQLIERFRSQFPNNFHAACAAVVAHEMAHIKQFQLGHLEDLEEYQLELHADYLAGYYIGYQYAIELANERDADTFFDVFFSLGDDDFFSEDHHGSPSQRKRASIAGWNKGKLLLPISKAFYQGKLFVKEFVRGGG